MRLLVSVVGGPSAVPFLEMCMQSLWFQTKEPHRIRVTLDGGLKAWGAPLFATSLIGELEGFQRTRVNDDTRYALANTLENVRRLDPDPEDIIVTVDADDWLCRRDALEQVYAAHSKGAWVTYGSWVSNRRDYPAGLPPYDPGADARQAEWRATQLRSWRYGLLRRIKPEDLRDENGDLFTCCPDLAIMIPAIEMAGWDRVKYIRDPIYFYNRDSGASVADTRREVQVNTERLIRSRPKYERIENL